MTHHRGDDRGAQREREEENARRGAGSRNDDHRFLDLELSRALSGEATRLARQAYREALVEKIKERLLEQLGDMLDGLAEIAVQDLMLDIEANLDIERRIRNRAEARLAQADLIEALFKKGEATDVESPQESSEK